MDPFQMTQDVLLATVLYYFPRELTDIYGM